MQFTLVKKEILYFTSNLTKIQQYTIEMCLKIIASGISSTLMKFGDKYFDYGGKCIKKKFY